MNLSRRHLLTGLLSSAAAIAIGPIAKILPPLRDGFETYTSSFRWNPAAVAADWKYISRIADLPVSTMPLENLDLFAQLRMVGTFPRNSNAGMTFSEVA